MQRGDADGLDNPRVVPRGEGVIGEHVIFCFFAEKRLEFCSGCCNSLCHSCQYSVFELNMITLMEGYGRLGEEDGRQEVKTIISVKHG